MTRPIPPGQEEIIAAADSALTAGREYMDRRRRVMQQARAQIDGALSWLEDDDARQVVRDLAGQYGVTAEAP